MTAIAVALKSRLIIVVKESKYHATHDLFFSLLYIKLKVASQAYF